MFTIKDIIGDVVYLSLRDPKQLLDIGIDREGGHFIVRGHDHIGLWIEHPNLFYTRSEDNEGKPIPDKNRIKEQFEGIFLISWDNIKTVMHYPGREGFDLPSEFDKKIGFDINNQKG